MGRLDGRIALVTGGARGIGFAIARGLAQAGALPVLADLAAGQATEAASGLKGAKGYGLDVSDLAACEGLAARIAAEVGQISILVNNAGVIYPERIDAPDAPAHWARTMAVNVGGAFNMCRSFYPQLKASAQSGLGGAVINLASIRSFAAVPNGAAYAASKGAVMQLTKSLAVEWAREGIRVNAIAPGFIETDFVPAAEKTPEREAMILSRTPLYRQGQPEEIAGAAVFLASTDAQFVTGAILPVDGGYLAS